MTDLVTTLGLQMHVQLHDLPPTAKKFLSPQLQCAKFRVQSRSYVIYDTCYLQGSGNTRHKGWCILRKSWKPYKPYVTEPLAAAHQAGRLVFFDWILQRPEGLKSRYCRIRSGLCCKLVPSSRTRDIGPL